MPNASLRYLRTKVIVLVGREAGDVVRVELKIFFELYKKVQIMVEYA